jgi:hypothetical protein
VVKRAKRYAKDHHVSVSGLVENYLAEVSAKAPDETLPPILRKIRGLLKGVRFDPATDYRAEHRKHLEGKYR